MSANPTVVTLGRRDTDAVVDLMAEAFHDYPVMLHVLGREGDYERRLHRLTYLFVMSRVLRDDPMFGIFDGDVLAAAATVSFPDAPGPPRDLLNLFSETWTNLGHDAGLRYEAYANVWQNFLPKVPHAHLNMIGTLNAYRGKGLGRALMEYVQRFAMEIPGYEGVSLTTENPANVPMYEHVGYEVIAHRRVTPELETWGMYRPNAPRDDE
jgi:GNAT superfamily N-acetyltransferase